LQEFNAQTSHLEPGLPTPVIVEIQPDRTFKFSIRTPPTSLLLKRAAGITNGSSSAGTQIAGNVSLKHIYEIAKIKMRDSGGVGEEQVSLLVLITMIAKLMFSSKSFIDVQNCCRKCKEYGLASCAVRKVVLFPFKCIL
jgi:ribosomal protein L11